MKQTVKDYVLYGFIAIGIAVIVLLSVNRVRQQRDVPLSRALDTVNVGTTPNDGTGDPLRTAFIKVNRLIVMADSLDLDSLTHNEMQSLHDMENIEDAVLFHVGDTTVTAVVGKIVFKTSNSHFYGCVRTTGAKWKILDN